MYADTDTDRQTDIDTHIDTMGKIRAVAYHRIDYATIALKATH